MENFFHRSFRMQHNGRSVRLRLRKHESFHLYKRISGQNDIGRWPYVRQMSVGGGRQVN